MLISRSRAACVSPRVHDSHRGGGSRRPILTIRLEEARRACTRCAGVSQTCTTDGKRPARVCSVWRTRETIGRGTEAVKGHAIAPGGFRRTRLGIHRSIDYSVFSSEILTDLFLLFRKNFAKKKKRETDSTLNVTTLWFKNLILKSCSSLSFEVEFFFFIHRKAILLHIRNTQVIIVAGKCILNLKKKTLPTVVKVRLWQSMDFN